MTFSKCEVSIGRVFLEWLCSCTCISSMFSRVQTGSFVKAVHRLFAWSIRKGQDLCWSFETEGAGQVEPSDVPMSRVLPSGRRPFTEGGARGTRRLESGSSGGSTSIPRARTSCLVAPRASKSQSTPTSLHRMIFAI